MEKQDEFTIIPPAVVDAIKNNKCGVCGRPIKKISKEMKAHPKLACGICRAKEGEKRCLRCGETKNVEEFPVRTDRKNRRNVCNSCYLAEHRVYNIEKKEQVKEWRDKRYNKLLPWMKHHKNIRARCENPKNVSYKNYGGRGIKNFLTIDDVKSLWDRDRAFSMKRPVIHRENNDKDYTIENCKFLEDNQHRILHEQLKKINRNILKPKEDEIDSCLKSLANDDWLWDLRCWNKYKDINEVGAYIDNPMHKNSGSAHYCVERLKFYSVDKELIIQAIMSNPHIQYKDRIVPCMLVTHADAFEDNIPTIECEKVKKQGHYGGGICNKCNGEPEPLEFEVITSKGNKVKVKCDRTFHNHFEFEGPTISETGYRSEFHGMGDLDIDDEKIPEMAKIMADRLEIDVEIAKIAKEKKDKRAQNKKGKKNG